MNYSDLVFVDGVKKYLDERINIAEQCENIFLFGSARGGIVYTSI